MTDLVMTLKSFDFLLQIYLFLARCPSSPPGWGSGVPSHREGVQGPHALHRVHPEGSRTLRHGQDHPTTLIQTRVQRRRRHEVHCLQPVHQQNDEQVRGKSVKSEYKVSIYGQVKRLVLWTERAWLAVLGKRCFPVPKFITRKWKIQTPCISMLWYL